MKKKSWLDVKIENADSEELRELGEKIDTRLFGEDETKDEELKDFVHVGELEEEAKVYVQNWGKMQGLSTGLKAVDYNMRGLVGGELTILAGETSNGKTALGVNIAANVAKAGHTVLFVTLEITQVQLTARLMKVLDGTPLTEVPLIMQKKDELDWRDVDKVVAAAKENGAELVIIDHLHYFTREVDKIAEDLGRITKQFKKNAIRHNIPIILISHVRKKTNNVGKKPELSNDALRGSSLIAQDADIVMFVHKVGDDKVIVKTTKNRNRGFNFENDTTYLEFTDGAVMRDVRSAYQDVFKDQK